MVSKVAQFPPPGKEKPPSPPPPPPPKKFLTFRQPIRRVMARLHRRGLCYDKATRTILYAPWRGKLTKFLTVDQEFFQPAILWVGIGMLGMMVANFAHLVIFVGIMILLVVIRAFNEKPVPDEQTKQEIELDRIDDCTIASLEARLEKLKCDKSKLLSRGNRRMDYSQSQS